jgi:hypothetical protein
MKASLFLLCLLMLFSGVTHAEGGCPPGMIPYSGTDTNSCGPIPPGYGGNSAQGPQQMPLPAQWEARWGAIATDDATGSFGASTNAFSQMSAESEALAECHLKKQAACRIETSYRNGCAVMTIGDKMHNSNSAATLNETTQIGMKTCVDGGDTNCHVYYSGCSFPQRVQ